MRRILTGLVLILMLTSGASAGPSKEGVTAYGRSDFGHQIRL
jgi:hypothetical protein